MGVCKLFSSLKGAKSIQIRQEGDLALMAELRPILAAIVYFLTARCLKKMSPEKEIRKIFTRITRQFSLKDHSWELLLVKPGKRRKRRATPPNRSR